MRFLALLALCLRIQAAETFLVRNVRVFDGVRVIEKTSVLVSRGVIQQVGPDLLPPKDAQVVGGEGKTLLPGLIDAHTHINSVNDLRQALAFGVTTELVMFNWPGLQSQFRALDRKGQTPQMADARFADILATVPGGHGTQYGLPIPVIRRPQEAQAFVDARIAEGSDYIKIIYGAGGPTISRETLAALVTAAHERGKLAVAHITSIQNAHEALEAGVDGLMHMIMDARPDPELAALARKHGAFVVPTFSVQRNTICGMAGGREFSENPRFTPDLMLSAIKALALAPGARYPASVCEVGPAAIPSLRDAGVPILVGTDATNSTVAHGITVHGELDLLVKAGLTPIEALAGATSAAADAFRLKDRGRIAPGQRADLLLVNGDPTKNILDTREIAAVWKQGHAFDRTAYRAVVHTLDDPLVPAGSQSGKISDFEKGRVETNFGSNWLAFDGVRIQTVAGGSQTKRGSLAVSGEIEAGRPPYVWPGILFMPVNPNLYFQREADLSSWSGFAFWSRGDGGTCRVIAKTTDGQQEKTFVAGPDWQRHTFSFTDLNIPSGKGLVSIIIAGPNQPGRFAFQLDDVELFK